MKTKRSSTKRADFKNQLLMIARASRFRRNNFGFNPSDCAIMLQPFEVLRKHLEKCLYVTITERKNLALVLYPLKHARTKFREKKKKEARGCRRLQISIEETLQHALQMFSSSVCSLIFNITKMGHYELT